VVGRKANPWGKKNIKKKARLEKEEEPTNKQEELSVFKRKR